MAVDDDVFAPMHDALFEAFGVAGTVQRGVDAAVPVTIIIDRNQELLGEYGQVVQRVTVAQVQVAEWLPQEGDVFAWTDRFGSHSRKVDRLREDDGFVVKAVLHG